MPNPATTSASDTLPRSNRAWSSRAKAFEKAATGAAAVEFAIVVVPFLGFIFIIIQMGYFFFCQQSLDYATRMAARQIMTGNVQSSGLTAVQFRNTLICPLLSVPISCSNITVSVTVVPKTSNSSTNTGIYALINQSVPRLNPPNLDTTKGSFCTGNPGDYIFVDVAYNFSKFLDLVSSFTGISSNSSPMVLRSTAFLVNEPYQGSNNTPQTGC